MVTFASTVQVKTNPHFNEYSDKQRIRLWYTVEELQIIKDYYCVSDRNAVSCAIAVTS